jgi:hypothetical protein
MNNDKLIIQIIINASYPLTTILCLVLMQYYLKATYYYYRIQILVNLGRKFLHVYHYNNN